MAFNPAGSFVKSISIIVPVYNEEDSILPLHAAVVKHVEPLGIPFEILFVDDGSHDRTFTCLEELADADPRVVAIKFRKNAGQTAAMAAGIEQAHGEFLVTMDGDLQNDPADIPMMLEKIDEGFDLVVGWRINRQDKWLSRKLPSKIANWIIGKVTGLPIRDNGCSLKVYRASVIKGVPLYSDMHRFIPAMTIPLGARVAEVGVRHHSRQFGTSKYGLSRIYKVILDLLSIRTILLFARRPITLFSNLATLFLGLAAISAAVAIYTAQGNDPTTMVVPIGMAVLLGSLSAFLYAAGFIAAVIHTTFRKSNPGQTELPILGNAS